MYLMVQLIIALSNMLPGERDASYRQLKKRTDSKIKTFVLQQIVQVLEKKAGALLPAATTWSAVAEMLSSLRFYKKREEAPILLIPTQPRLASPLLSAPSKRIPIGIRRCEPYHCWMNSLIQFLLFLPGTWELCSLVPRSFRPLREFVDRYVTDQARNLPVTSADSVELARCLIRNLPSRFLQGKPTLYEILNGFIRAFFSFCPFVMSGELQPVVLHPEWHVISESMDALQNTLIEDPAELLIGPPFPLKDHYFPSSDGASYDLDAFIELRPDGDDREHFIAYLKCEGAWYQCDDDRIIQFRSHCLKAPLRRAVLLHYKRVDLLRHNKYLKK